MTTTKKTRRQYRDASNKRLPGVTTVLGVIDKPALLGWAARTGADAAVEAMINGAPPDDAKEKGRKAVFTRRDKAADLGTRAHALVEAHFAGESVDVDVSNAEDAKVYACARRAIDAIDAAYDVIMSERALVNLDQGFGGTLDLVVKDRATGALLIADLKTGKGVHDEVIPQLAAYSSMLALDGTTIDGGLVIHAPIDGDGVTMHSITPEKLAAGMTIFCSALAIYRAKKLATLVDGKDVDDAP